MTTKAMSLSRSAPPLAEALRPQRFADIVGQEALLGKEGALGRLLLEQSEETPLPSMILWGPPGCGKTSLARLLARHQGGAWESISAVFSSVSELRKIFARAETSSRRPVLFVDEAHHFNRAQQEAFLPVVERGTITLIAATTENPSFAMRAALVSRCRVFVLLRLSESSLDRLLSSGIRALERPLSLTEGARRRLLDYADGDGRVLLNSLEALAVLAREGREQAFDEEELSRVLQRRLPLYDKAEDGHYNLISALHKAIRGSDCDAALYWLARMLCAGESPIYIARRLLRIAYEDVGLADPEAASHAVTAWQTFERLGSPEGEIALYSLVVYLSTCPKSNALYRCEKASQSAARRFGSLSPPLHALNAPTKLMKDLGYSKGYRYDHAEDQAFSGQNYFPRAMERERYYEPSERGFEREIAKRLSYWTRLRAQRTSAVAEGG